MNKDEIIFKKQYEFKSHSKYKQLYTYLYANDPEFSFVHQVFERLVVEPCISAGINTEIINLTIDDNSMKETSFAKLVGYNFHLEERVKLAQEFLNLYEKCGFSWSRFSKKMIHTQYYKKFEEKKILLGLQKNPLKKIVQSQIQKQSIQKQMKNFVLMFESMKSNQGNIVHASKSGKANSKNLHFYDLPWAINYLGYTKKRDGAHRMAIRKYLGHNTCPTLVFDYSKVNLNFLNQIQAPSYIIENFDWYSDLILKIKKS